LTNLDSISPWVIDDDSLLIFLVGYFCSIEIPLYLFVEFLTIDEFIAHESIGLWCPFFASKTLPSIESEMVVVSITRDEERCTHIVHHLEEEYITIELLCFIHRTNLQMHMSHRGDTTRDRHICITLDICKCIDIGTSHYGLAILVLPLSPRLIVVEFESVAFWICEVKCLSRSMVRTSLIEFRIPGQDIADTLCE
jgi:hypothetical protein